MTLTEQVRPSPARAAVGPFLLTLSGSLRTLPWWDGSYPVPHAELAVAGQVGGARVAALMAELGLNKAQGGVFLAQLKGMCDHISFGLGARGFRVYKYVPYGPVREVMPYLLRRAEENADIMRGANKEVHVLGRELRRRLATSVFGEQPSFVRDNIVVGHRVMGPRMVGQAA